MNLETTGAVMMDQGGKYLFYAFSIVKYFHISLLFYCIENKSTINKENHITLQIFFFKSDMGLNMCN